MVSVKKSFLVLFSAILILASLAGIQPATAAETGTKTITILHTNDSHAKVKPDDGGMGFAKLATLIKELQQENANTLLLDAGDTLHGTPFATVEKGESITQILNKLGYDAMAAGNHDFNYGYQQLLALQKMMDFPVLSANVRNKNDDSLLLQPYKVEEVDGIKIGIFGLSTPETHYKTNPKNVEGLEFTDPVEEAKAMVKILKETEKVDMVVALTHLGIDESSTDTSIRVAEGAPGIDLIVDGHSHSVLVEGQKAGESTLIVSAGEHTKNLGVVELTFDGSMLVNKEARLITKEDASGTQEDADVKALIDEVSEAQDKILSEKIGTTKTLLDGVREHVRAGETNLGNLLTDAMLEASNADAAITNGGGIRASIEAGDITKKNVIDVLPFGNFLVTKKFTGAEIKAALEHGTGDFPNVKGAFPHVSGMTFEIDLNAEKGKRVKNLQIAGNPVDLEKVYVVATNDFMAVGGDGYTMFEKGPLVNEYGALDEVLIEYIKANSPIDAKKEGRIATYLPFKDVPAYSWSRQYIADLYYKNLVKGTSETTFAPKAELTRSQFASLLVRALDLKATKDAPFTDIANLPEETKQEIAAAYEFGLVKGVSDTIFNPKHPITRAEMTIMLERAYELQTEAAYEPKAKAPFTDITKLTEEAQEAIAAAYELGYVEGYGKDLFQPKGHATRQEAAKVISVFLDSIEQ
ncbi:2',3'-cyclic-nucleotide 2'-phosphodiesterase (5'-nucleotidase family) [Cytobacillus oceanisediminis]|uniref:2',3'-cyclic-nucleotide 2'-phosphodiesterase (5'-nucleotidase family) n=1 Tax=Cytobacillus oceanisediminis TaxID=665099 RepID=A0A2V3A0H6_9BACI|nr:5'-nucleotidase C-terminal domain-containing protein [Cytobacillus oceanisediminis]PWW29423.1 2',3'-cyclic-nucleotide 2'-phosphodiesterase (5'-nucleotidase family) [Cytobacillus oceanisediminis]